MTFDKFKWLFEQDNINLNDFVSALSLFLEYSRCLLLEEKLGEVESF
jgi:hypothetical protein